MVFGCSRKGAQQKPVGAKPLDPPKSRIIESFPKVKSLTGNLEDHPT